jgi:hypothetical protein
MSEASFPRMGVHPWPSLTVQDHPSEHLHPSPTGSCFPEDNRRSLTRDISPAVSFQKLTSLRTGEAWVVAHLTFEDESVPCILLANLGQLSTWGPPVFGLWLMYAYHRSQECCYQNSGFSHLLFLCRHHCWVVYPQPYHLLSVLWWWSVYLF